jgi:diguanylate cyclase
MMAMMKNSDFRILIIDDNVAIHEDYRKTLALKDLADKNLLELESELFGDSRPEVQTENFNIDCALQGREGIDMAIRAKNEGRPYAVAFVDGRMPPGLDGIETIRELWQACPDIQVVLCTAYSDYSWRDIQKMLGESDSLVILKKPFDTVEVVQLTHALTRKWALDQEIQGRLHKLAFYDGLTGLPNRTLFLDRLEMVLQMGKRHGQAGALLFLDVDHFKRINDTLGHIVGDHLLKLLSQRMTACLRATDTVARLHCQDVIARMGGDEFSIILPCLEQPDEATTVALRLAEQLAQPIDVDGNQVSLTTSIGITYFPEDGNDVETLLKNADLAMFNAKHKGPNAVIFYQESMNIAVMKRLTMENHLRQAIMRNEFSLHYQPQISLSTGQFTGFEALLRWNSPELGAVPPLDFIPLAEENGMIVTIGEWVLRTACAQARTWIEQGLPLQRMAVNVSLRQFLHNEFPQIVSQALVESSLAPDQLELEITESMIMSDPPGVIRTLHELKDQGVQIAIDDFGTGYSSLGRLRDLPIDCLKIDRSFVKGISMGMRHEPILNAVMIMAAGMGLRVIAEGVETQEQVDFLRTCQCPEAQGYLFSRPLNDADATSFLQENRQF